MAFVLKADEKVGSGLARVACKTLAAGIDELGGEAPLGDAIHTARKSVKKVRALVDLVRSGDDPQLRRVDQRLRRVGHRLSEIRDARAIAETFGRISGRYRMAGAEPRRIARQLAERIGECEKESEGKKLRADAARALRKVTRRIRRSQLKRADVSSIAPGVKRSYRRANAALKTAAARGRVADLHRWRRRVKTLWYQLRLLEQRQPAAKLVRALEEIEEWLGEAHNVALLRERLASGHTLHDAAAMASLNRAFDRYEQDLRRKAFGLGKRIFGRAPKAFVRQLRGGRQTRTARDAA